MLPVEITETLLIDLKRVGDSVRALEIQYADAKAELDERGRTLALLNGKALALKAFLKENGVEIPFPLK